MHEFRLSGKTTWRNCRVQAKDKPTDEVVLVEPVEGCMGPEILYSEFEPALNELNTKVEGIDSVQA